MRWDFAKTISDLFPSPPLPAEPNLGLDRLHHATETIGWGEGTGYALGRALTLATEARGIDCADAARAIWGIGQMILMGRLVLDEVRVLHSVFGAHELASAWGFADVPSFMHAVAGGALTAAKDRAPPHIAWLRFATLLAVNSARR